MTQGILEGKKHYDSVFLMERVLESHDLDSYAHAHG